MTRVLIAAATALIVGTSAACALSPGVASASPVERHMLIVLYHKQANANACTAQTPHPYHVTENDALVVEVLNLCDKGQDVAFEWLGGGQPTTAPIGGKAPAGQTMTTLPAVGISPGAADHTDPNNPKPKRWTYRVKLNGHSGPDPDIVVDPVV